MFNVKIISYILLTRNIIKNFKIIFKRLTYYTYILMVKVNKCIMTITAYSNDKFIFLDEVSYHNNNYSQYHAFS